MMIIYNNYTLFIEKSSCQISFRKILYSVKIMRVFFIILLILVFLAGLYVYLKTSAPITKATIVKNINETLQNKETKSSACPNMLVKKGSKLFLYNKLDTHDELPIEFNNLDEYIEYLNNERKNGKKCPVLYLQQENDVQGKDVYRVRPSPFNQQGGIHPITAAPVIDSNDDSKIYNVNNYPGFDPIGLQIGVYNKLDEIHDSTKNTALSDNPMDPNWGGVEFTQQAVDSGKYEENIVTKPQYFSPKGQFIPGLYNVPTPPSYHPK
jgi:hypothetical protein